MSDPKKTDEGMIPAEPSKPRPKTPGDRGRFVGGEEDGIIPLKPGEPMPDPFADLDDE